MTLVTRNHWFFLTLKACLPSYEIPFRAVAHFLLTSVPALAQDTLLLINGKTMIVKSVDLKDFTIAYRTLGKKPLTYH